MAKNMPKVFYCYQGKWLTLGRLYGKLKKRQGKARILASVVVGTKQNQKVKIVFVRHRHKRDWLAILSTKTDDSAEDIVRIYGKRWDIEVFFKMIKHHLNLKREVQLRDYDGIIGHTTLVMTRYIFFSIEQRYHSDQKTIESLFFACSDEVRDLSLIDALHRLLLLVVGKISSRNYTGEDDVTILIDDIMAVAVEIIQSMKLMTDKNIVITIG